MLKFPQKIWLKIEDFNLIHFSRSIAGDLTIMENLAMVRTKDLLNLLWWKVILKIKVSPEFHVVIIFQSPCLIMEKLDNFFFCMAY